MDVLALGARVSIGGRVTPLILLILIVALIPR